MANVIVNARIASGPTAGTVGSVQQKLHLLLKKLISVNSYDKKTNLGLLALRVIGGMSLFLKHGWEKIAPGPGGPGHPTFSFLLHVQSDPFHIGHAPSELIAMTSDAICAILVMLGLGTRLAAGFIAPTVFVAWSMVKHFVFLGKGSATDSQPKSGEILVLYMAVSLALALTGPGKYSLDWMFWRKKEEE